MFERSEFLPLLKAAVEWREPADGKTGQGGRAYFFCFISLDAQRNEGAERGRNPATFCLLTRL